MVDIRDNLKFDLTICNALEVELEYRDQPTTLEELNSDLNDSH